jgi:hypothetical protein
VQQSDFTATIDWGDGSSPSPGDVAGANGTFTVRGSHPYAADSAGRPGGVYAVTVTVTGPGGARLTGTASVAVVRPPLAGSGGSAVASAAGSVSNAQLATFTEPDVQDTAGQFRATVDWGDGTPPDTTAVVAGSAGLFRVLGSHAYAASGVYQAQVALGQPGHGLAPGGFVVARVVVPVVPDAAPAPVARDDDVALLPGTSGYDEGAPGILFNDLNVRGGLVRIQVVQRPTWGPLLLYTDCRGNYTGAFSYTPAANWPGGDWFSYRVVVNGRASNVAYVNIGTRNNGYTSYTDLPRGNPQDVDAGTQGGLLLDGGGPEQDQAFTWPINHAHARGNTQGGDIVVLRTSGGGSLDPYLRELARANRLPLNSVRTLVFDAGNPAAARAAANSAAVVRLVRNAEAVFIAGGDQSKHINLWTGTAGVVGLASRISGRNAALCPTGGPNFPGRPCQRRNPFLA